MAKKNNTLLYVGGAGVLALLLLNKKSNATGLPNLSTNNSGGANTSNGQYNASNYYMSPDYQWKDINGKYINRQPTEAIPNFMATALWPKMVKDNPNVGNSSYRLTDQEAQQLLDNYTDLREALTNLSQSRHRPLYDVVRTNWNETCVPEMRTFLPFTPPFGGHYDGVLENPNANKGGWLTKALSSAASFIPVVGGSLSTVISSMGAIDDAPVVSERLNDKDAEILITGGAIMKEFLPMFFESYDGIALGADAKLNELLEIYTHP